MPNLSLTVGALSKTLVIASNDVTRWLEAYRARFNLGPAATQAQIFDALSNWLLVDVANGYVIHHERQKAAEGAADGVPPIPLPPA